MITALEKVLYEKQFSAFELLYTENCKYGDFAMMNRVLMRNL